MKRLGFTADFWFAISLLWMAAAAFQSVINYQLKKLNDDAIKRVAEAILTCPAPPPERPAKYIEASHEL